MKWYLRGGLGDSTGGSRRAGRWTPGGTADVALTGSECVGPVSATTVRVAEEPRVGVVVGRRRSAGQVSRVVLWLSGQSLTCQGMGLVIVEHVAWCFATAYVC